MKPLIIPIILSVLLIFTCQSGKDPAETLARLEKDQSIHGFTAKKVYENASGDAIGARFIDDRSGFLVDLMYIESVPQAFLWVKSPPTTDMGRPHTCEHLLLGKGNLGRYVATQEDMSLTTSTAYTAQLRTAYHFNTVGGYNAFTDIFEAKLNALINPDFTDEETRREVKHFGVVENEQTGELGLEEKGTVYTEMVSSFEKPWYHYMSPLAQMIYGEGHPMSNSSGGIPEAIGRMTAEDMREFVNETYHLGNMGAIVSLPSGIGLESFLQKLSEILPAVQDDTRASRTPGITALDLPQSRPEEAGKLLLTNYPSPNSQDPGYFIFGWPAIQNLTARETYLADLFFNAFSSGSTSNLYKLFIDSETRKLDLGAQYVWGDLDTDFGASPYFSLGNVNNAEVDLARAAEVRRLVAEELQKLYDMPNDSEELQAFNELVKGRLIENQKQTQDYLNSPPMFGFRSGSAGGWLSLMGSLELEDGFRVSLVKSQHAAEVSEALMSGQNIWKGVIDKLGLLTTQPYGVACTADLTLLAQAEESKTQRLEKKIAEYKAYYKTEDEQEALERYRADFDKNTAELDAIAAQQKLPGFIEDPPLEIDEHLVYQQGRLKNEMEIFEASFENMRSMSLRLYLDVNHVAPDQLMYLPTLPSLMTATGVMQDGQAVSYDDMQDRLRQEILDLSAWYSNNAEVGRNELVLSVKGGDLEESRTALRWASAVLYNPLLTIDNLPRIRDLIDQELGAYRNRTKRSEESWVRNPQNAYQYQQDPVYLSTASFLTEQHHTLRLKFQLMDPDGETIEVLTDLAMMGKDGVEQITGTLDALRRERPSQVLRTTLDELQKELNGLPPGSLREDWQYLCETLRSDLNMEPGEAMENIVAVLTTVRSTPRSRLAMVSNSKDRAALRTDIENLVEGLKSPGAVTAESSNRETVIDRVRSRDALIEGRPVYVGLVFEGTRNGVLMYNARIAGEYDTSDEAILTGLAGKMYSGGGPHGFFMNTWSAGLAYSNGYRFDQRTGRAAYYAERCPNVAETMRFVVGLIEEAKISNEMLDYATAQVFGNSRAQSPYETRAFSMAADLRDGYTPEMVRAYRKKVLAMRSKDNLTESIESRLEKAYGPVLVGYGEPASVIEDGVYFLIGPPQQFESMGAEIDKYDPGHSIVKLYPRDFWIIPQPIES